MWSKFDDDYLENKKIRLLSSSDAILMHAAAILYCSKMESDGFFPRSDVTLIAALAKVPARKSAAVVAELVSRNLFHDHGDRYEVHDYLDYNPSKAEIDEKRRIANERSGLRADAALMGRVKARDKSLCRYCGTAVDWSDRRGAKGGTYDHVAPISRGGKTTYHNLVVSCRGCNSKKCDRTPHEASMALLEPGITPNRLPVTVPVRGDGSVELNPVTRSPIPTSLSQDLSSSPVLEADPDQSNPCAKRPTGYSLCFLFGRLRREVLQLQCPPGAENPSDANGKAASFAERLDPQAVADIEPTMRAFLLHLKRGDDGWNADPNNASLSFGAWRDRFGDLRAELAGAAARVEPRKQRQLRDEQSRPVEYPKL